MSKENYTQGEKKSFDRRSTLPVSVIEPSDELRKCLADITRPVVIFKDEDGKLVVQNNADSEYQPLASAPSLPINALGDRSFQNTYNCWASFYAGSMANGISSPEMVIALGKGGLLGSYGSGGVPINEIETSIQKIQSELSNQPYAVNLLNSPFEPERERLTVGILLRYGVRILEASAYLGMTRGLVLYRASGLRSMPDGTIDIQNRVIAKISRKEIARRFMRPAPADILQSLVSEGKLTQEQANMAGKVPIADDVTVEADSGGHTDNRPLLCLIPTMLAERNAIQKEQNYPTFVRIGAAGGISTPESALAAFMAGAAYIVTGSINQCCVESAASAHTRSLLAKTDMADVIMAPAADMFEMGVKVQVLKRGTMFAMRASKLYETYQNYESVEAIPEQTRKQIEEQILQRSMDEVWRETEAFFEKRDPSQIQKAKDNPKHKMALIFRWYLGLSSRWSSRGEPGREMDYQIWCGPAMGTFNDWVRGTYLEDMENRHAADINLHILTGAAYLYRIRILEAQGIVFPEEVKTYLPQAPLV
ncbi:MAG: PfaD family polyunsaturated fatty acid/polyketide biosynthesis protein [Anaerolineaceae bacterium]|nr:PfaD family polyunsaturated fatty acid/polyketide biosynthesis protein [Anaerolineaceae bacterium]